MVSAQERENERDKGKIEEVRLPRREREHLHGELEH